MSKKLPIYTFFKIYDSYRRGKEICSYFPVKLWIETTNRCNLSCALCPNSKLGPGQRGDMDYGLYIKIIDQAQGNVSEINLFHRGEPLLHSQLIEMIDYASKKNIRTRIHTNATLLDTLLNKSLIESGLDFITFSVDSYIKEEYERLKPGADFDEVLQKITGFLSQKKETKSKKPFCTIQIMNTNGKDGLIKNKKQLKDFLYKFSGLPLDRIARRTPHNWGGMLKGGNGNTDFTSNKGSALQAKITSACTFPWYSLTVFFDGKVYLCPQDFGGSIMVGDANTENLAGIFNGGAIKNIRKKHSKKDILDLWPCNSCDRVRRKTIAKVPSEYLGFFSRGIFNK